jgi:hypothetical protein
MSYLFKARVLFVDAGRSAVIVRLHAAIVSDLRMMLASMISSRLGMSEIRIHIPMLPLSNEAPRLNR